MWLEHRAGEIYDVFVGGRGKRGGGTGERRGERKWIGFLLREKRI